MTSKVKYGQFYTTNIDYILNGINIPRNIDIIEPFAGNGDIVKYLNNKGYSNIQCFDIDPKYDNTIKQDTLLNPPNYKNKYVITNPPYLFRNKSKDKILYDIYKTDDLYKCFIKSIKYVDGGIIIIPTNFLCSNDYKIRDLFFSSFDIDYIKVFEEQVFDDTDVQVCVIQFHRSEYDILRYFKCLFTPENKEIEISLDKQYNWLFGGDIYKPVKSKYKIGRLLIGQTPTTNLKLYCTDTGGNNRIRLVIDKNHYYGKRTDRNICTITSNIPIENEEYVCNEFNNILNSYRDKYHSMFLTSFRNSTTYARKRISFKLAFNIIKQIIS